MSYVLATGSTVQEYPYSLTDLRLQNKGVSWPQTITDDLAAKFNVFPVTPTAAPEYEPATQELVELNPILTGGKWIQMWQVRGKTAEEQAAYKAQKEVEVRAQRDRMLVDDVDLINGVRWSAMSPEVQQMWSMYRQALLNVPEQSGFPFNVVWPELPR